MQKIHGRWFRLSDSRFDAVHYGGMGAYKLGIFFFNLTPLLALWFAGGAVKEPKRVAPHGVEPQRGLNR